MRTPVVSAIGHETDFSLLDFVADARAATPTAAAELVAYDYYSLVRELRDTTARLKRSVGQAYARKRDRLRAACFKVSGEAKAYYGGRASAVWRRIERVKALVEAKLNAAEGKLGRAADKLDALSPLKVLARGYFNLRAAGGTVTSVRSLSVGDEIEARGADGIIRARVTDIKECAPRAVMSGVPEAAAKEE